MLAVEDPDDDDDDGGDGVVVVTMMMVVTRMVLPTVIYWTSPVSAEITRDQQKFR